MIGGPEQCPHFDREAVRVFDRDATGLARIDYAEAVFVSLVQPAKEEIECDGGFGRLHSVTLRNERSVRGLPK
jgi:hypothetical protein